MVWSPCRRCGENLTDRGVCNACAAEDVMHGLRQVVRASERLSRGRNGYPMPGAVERQNRAQIVIDERLRPDYKGSRDDRR